MNATSKRRRDISTGRSLGRGDSPLSVRCTDFARSRRRCRGQSDTPMPISVSEVRKVLLASAYWNSKLPVVLLIRAPAARERDVVVANDLSNVRGAV